MDETDIPSCDAKGENFNNSGKNGGDEIDQVNASAESWLIQVKGAFERQHKTRQVSKKVCIYRVPKIMMICKPEAYEPMLVSLGPYHHKINPKLSAMDEHKVEAVHRTLRRVKGVTITDLISEIRKSESEIRKCYEEAIEWNGEILSWMLAMDACFILEILRFDVPVDSDTESDIEWFSLVKDAGRVNYLRPVISDDILKLENQIPLCILIKILQMEFGTREQAVLELAEMLIQCKDLVGGYPFSSKLSEDGEAKSKVKDHIGKACHLLDLYRRTIKDLLTHSSSESANADECFNATADIMNSSHIRLGWWMIAGSWLQRLSCINCILSRQSDQYDSMSTPTAELLENSGIKLQSGQIGFEKRRFRSSILCLPQISVDDSTEIRLRNLMVYEECQRCSWSPEKTVISNYICILNDLIGSDKDVSILRKAQVIRSGVGSDKYIADMFNHIGKGITLESVEQFEEVMKQVREHCSSTWNMWVSQFKEEHCSKPWYVVSLVAAMLILGMTAVQAFYSVKNN